MSGSWICYLAFLPDGRLSGHMVDSRTHKTYGVLGMEVWSERECMRDAEWKLLQISVINFDSQEEVRLLAERTGGDAAKLHAPVEPHGVEEELLQECSEGCDAAACLDFTCDTIMADKAAEAHLHRFNRSLCRQDAVVNQGHMMLSGIVFSNAARQAQQMQQAESAAMYDSDFD
ncbi:hypothetical protein WJX72_002899 [[Myrmecia] bisecta]|uniref:Uncharacterized protein n=1 Tax=[Myrmecia] bisecta TaxID=41462 RepID=A0AAW1PXG0_9CHLO